MGVAGGGWGREAMLLLSTPGEENTVFSLLITCTPFNLTSAPPAWIPLGVLLLQACEEINTPVRLRQLGRPASLCWKSPCDPQLRRRRHFLILFNVRAEGPASGPPSAALRLHSHMLHVEGFLKSPKVWNFPSSWSSLGCASMEAAAELSPETRTPHK